LHTPLPHSVSQRSLELFVQGHAASLHRDQQLNWPCPIAHDWHCTGGQLANYGPSMQKIIVIGGGVAGLAAAITCAERGAEVELFEASESLGGRARSDTGPYKTNLGPHAMYKGGALWAWLSERRLMPPLARPQLTGVRFHYDGAIHRTPPLSLIPRGLRLRGRAAPSDQDFRSWVTDHSDERTAAMLSGLAGVYTFHHDPGELSAAFVWERTQRLLLDPKLPARFPVGGWGMMVDSMERHASSLGVTITTGERVTAMPNTTTIVAVALDHARELLDDPQLHWPSGNTVCLDLALHRRRDDPYVVSDLANAAWIERFTANDPSLAPRGEELVQAQMPIRPSESADAAGARLEQLLDKSFEGWRDRVTFRRRQVMDGRTGALDLPGSTWRDRPAIDRGDGVFLCGDQVAAPGCLAEVAFASAFEAGRMAVAVTQPRTAHAA
jgi:phytoene dehydrogenase-like protein